jgi:hypothetical protein
MAVDGASITERTSRRIPLSRRSHITGFQPLSTGIAEHESALERDFVTLTAFLDARASITSQPITLSFRHEGRARRYTPDFLVRWSNRRTELIEVKYQADLDANAEQLRPALEAARAWANESGAMFRAVTEHEIRATSSPTKTRFGRGPRSRIVSPAARIRPMRTKSRLARSRIVGGKLSIRRGGPMRCARRPRLITRLCSRSTFCRGGVRSR